MGRCTGDRPAVVVMNELAAKNLPQDTFTQSQIDQANALLKTHRAHIKITDNLIVFDDGGAGHGARLYVPASLRKKRFRMFHGSIISGHPRAETTLQHLSRFAWWPSIKDDVTKWCSACPRCQLGKPYGTTLDREYNIERRVPSPFFKLIVDSKGPLPMTPRGNKYVLCIYDDDTHFNVWIPSSSNTASSVAQALIDHVILTFGSPQIIKSGRDSEWVNALIQEIEGKLGILHETTFPYAPQGIGGNERRHREIESFVTTLSGREDWDLLVPLGAFATNNQYDKSIGMSPFEAMFGRRALNPLDTISVAILMKTIGTSSFEGLRLEDWVSHFRDRTQQRDAHKFAQQLLAKERFEKQRGKGASQRKVQLGDLVAIRATPMKSSMRASKLTDWWIGPFKVIWVSQNGAKLRMEYLAEPDVIVERRSGEVKLFVEGDEDLFNADAAQFDVESILDARGSSEEREYLVKWAGYPEEFNLWIPRESFSNSPMIKDAEERFKVASNDESPPEVTSSVDLDPTDIEEVLGVVSTRRGPCLSIKVRKQKFPIRIPVKALSPSLREHALVKEHI